MSHYEQVTPISPPEGVILRLMKASDVSHVCALHRNLLPVSYPAAFFIQLLVNPRRLCLVAMEGGVIVGFASAAVGLVQPSSVGADLTPADREPSQSHSRVASDIPRSHVTLLTLGVLPAYRRRGIGRSLVHGVIQRLEESAPQSHHSPCEHISDQDNKTTVLVQVQVAPSNSAGRCFYTHLGMMDQQISNDPRLHLGPGSQTSVMAGVLCV